MSCPANCSDQALLDKYGLKANDAILADAAHLPIYEEITAEKYAPKYLAGGAAQNSARGAQYMLPAKSVVYIGCIGQDAFGEQLTNACVKEGVLTKYRVEKEQPTGRCAVVITGHDRSMVTDLAAANHYKLEHLKSPEIWSYVEKAKIYYVGGYHLTVCVPAVLALGEHAAKTGKVCCCAISPSISGSYVKTDPRKIFAMNLSAPFLATFFKEQMDSVAPYWDYIIGNESEALAYAEAHNFEVCILCPPAIYIASFGADRYPKDQRYFQDRCQDRGPPKEEFFSPSYCCNHAGNRPDYCCYWWRQAWHSDLPRQAS